MARQARALADRLLADGLLDADRPRTPRSHPRGRRREPAALARRRALHVPRPPLPTPPHGTGSTRPRGTGLGVLRRDSRASPPRSPPSGSTPRRRELLVLTRASAKSPRAAPVHPYYLAVRILDAAGRLLGEHRFLGMLTVAALYENVLDIPVVERRVRGAIQRAGFPLASYSGQQMLEVISGAAPRGAVQRHRAAAARHRRRRARRRRPARRAGVPAPRPVPPLRLVPGLPAARPVHDVVAASRWPRCCSAACGGTLGRLHRPGHRVRARARALHGAHRRATPPATPRSTSASSRTSSPRPSAPGTTGCCRCPAAPRWPSCCPGSRRRTRRPSTPRRRWSTCARRRPERRPATSALRLYAPTDGQDERRFTLYLAGAPATLTAVLPVLQQLGRRRARRAPLGDRPARRPALLDLRLRAAPGRRRPRPRSPTGRTPRSRPSSARRSRRRGGARRRPTGFSALVLRAGLPWREVAVLRAYARYARQLGNPYGVHYMADTLLAHPARRARRCWRCSRPGSTPRSTRRPGPTPRTTRWPPSRS